MNKDREQKLQSDQYKTRSKFQDMRRRHAESSNELRKQQRLEAQSRRRNLTIKEHHDVEMGSAGEDDEAAILTCAQVVEILGKNPGLDEKRYAFEEVRRMIASGKDISNNKMFDNGIVDALIQGLAIEDIAIQISCARALSDIAAGNSAQTRLIVEKGALQPLIQAMAHKDSDLLAEFATFAVANIAADPPEMRDVVIQSSGLVSLKILCRKVDKLQRSFAGTLAWFIYALCHQKEPFQMSLELAETLCWLLKSDDHFARRYGYYIIDSHDKAALMRDAGVLPHLKHLLCIADDKIVEPSLKVFGNITSIPDGEHGSPTQWVIDAGVLGVLKDAVERNEKRSADCCFLIANVIAGTETHVQSVIDYGLLSLVLEIMKTGNHEAQVEASWALKNLILNGTVAQVAVLVALKPMSSLAPALQDSSPDLLARALYTIDALVKMVGPHQLEGVKKEFEELGFIDTIGKLTTHENNEVAYLAEEIISKVL